MSGRPPDGGKGAGGGLFTMKEAAQKRNGRGEAMGRGGEEKKNEPVCCVIGGKGG
jgi:hypothetical protein